jgi:hypothetical protein
MIIKNLIDEDFVNYKKPSMFIAFPQCSFKCDREAGCSICQNSSLAKEPNIEINVSDLIDRYINNPITKAIVFGGLEPWDNMIDMSMLVTEIRRYTDDDIVIYTGYTEEEITMGKSLRKDIFCFLKSHYKNIIIKFGRFVPNQEKHYDEVLGVELASPNQYARRIS